MPYLILLSLALPLLVIEAQGSDSLRGYASAECPSCAAWNAPQAPLRIHGNTYYVGTRGLSAILITSARGHFLIDGGLPESAPRIAANIRALGFRIEDVRQIANSHAHYDHAGGISALQRASGAVVVAFPWSARFMERGVPDSADPQREVALAYPPVSRVRQLRTGDSLAIGSTFVVAHLTPGHTPGGTTWSWRSCEDDRCVHIVYADSQTPVSADAFRFSSAPTYPTVLRDFERSHELLESIRCDILLTPHPAASSLWERIAARDRGDRTALIDTRACRRYATTARQQLKQRLARELQR
jgi:metallo-beta-lactamase class B